MYTVALRQMIDVTNSESKNVILCVDKLFENLIHDICFMDYGCFSYSAPQTPVYRMTLSINIVLATQTSNKQKENFTSTKNVLPIYTLNYVHNINKTCK